MAEYLARQQKAVFGSVREISAVDYVQEVNKAGSEVWVVLHLYKAGYPFIIHVLCMYGSMCMYVCVCVCVCDVCVCV